MSADRDEDGAEQVVLGAMMLDASVVDDVERIITVDDLRKPAHHLVFLAAVAQRRAGRPTEPTALAAALGRRLSRVGGAAYLHTLVASVPTAANAGYYAELVRRAAILRRMGEAGVRLQQMAAETALDDVDAILPVVEREFTAVTAALGDAQDLTTPHLAAIPDYPIDALVGPLRDLVLAGRADGLHAALVGGAGLAALSALCGMASLHIAGTQVEVPAVWVALIGSPSSGKTPAQRFAFAHLRELSAAQRVAYRDEYVEWKSKGREGEPPHDGSYLMDDTTLEMVARWLERGGGTGCVDTDELRFWLGSLGRYRSGGGDGGDRGRWLSLWAGAPWDYQRVTNDTAILIRRPVLSICGTLQPSGHQLLGADEDGMRPRWLPHIAPNSFRPTRGPEQDLSGWNATLDDLSHRTSPRDWHLGPTARKVWTDAAEQWRDEMHRGAEAPSVLAALGKANAQAARIALVLAESRAPGADGRAEINEDEMTAAVALVGYVLNVWRALPGHHALALNRIDERVDPAVDQLAEWLEQRGGSASRSDIAHAKVGGARTADDLDAVLKRYEARYPGTVRKERRPGARGPLSTIVDAPHRDHSVSQNRDPMPDPKLLTSTVSARASGVIQRTEPAARSDSRRRETVEKLLTGNSVNSSANSFCQQLSDTKSDGVAQVADYPPDGDGGVSPDAWEGDDDEVVY